MFYCEFSKKLVKHNISPVKIVIEKRLRTYENTVNHKVKVTEGWEIVREISVAPDEVEKVMKKYATP